MQGRNGSLLAAILPTCLTLPLMTIANARAFTPPATAAGATTATTAPASRPVASAQDVERATIRELVARSFQMPTVLEQDHLAQMLNESEQMQYLAQRITRFVEQYPDDEARSEFEIERMRAMYLGACLAGRAPRGLYKTAAALSDKPIASQVVELAEYWQLRRELDRLHARAARGQDTEAERLSRMERFASAHPTSRLTVRLLEKMYEHGVQSGDAALASRALEALRLHHPQHVTTRALEGRERLRSNIGNLWQPALTTPAGQPLDWNAARREWTLVLFWSPGHDPSVATIRRLAAQRASRGAERLSIVSIAIGGSPQATRELLVELELEHTAAIEPLGWKSAITRDYGIRTLPTVLVLDRAGVLLRVETPVDWAFDDKLATLIDGWLAGGDAAPPAASRPAP